ncbi:gluconate 2-dehydrogenase subunit 3 family protein [Sinomonas notoginsengisoli]|uniref:gluconate 2-dehydrogenase subunit 3 family protein n=1 Tax=Sinomonas notoginsengisoli TaxID=1457311 RepID=UPI001F26B215|nr:gluconate 2-dehydrogenase subunit 3 family protein [Sinomonas notoginsengisoli]
MSLTLGASDEGGRFPGQNSLDQRDHWDETTAALILARTDHPPEVCFFTAEEEGVASALLDCLVGQDHADPDSSDGMSAAPHVPLVNLVDARLAAGETDGWHYANLPEDEEVWRRTVRYLDEDSRERYGAGFAGVTREQQEALLEAVHSSADTWHGLPTRRLWDLWLRYACTAFYSHPSLWDEIGFPGPAYPRGYGNLGLDRRERFEVPDARPGEQA